MKHPATQAPVQVNRLTIRYGGRVAVEDVGFRIERGTVYALLGPNGAGKTSIIRCLSGLRKPDVGNTSLLGFDAWRDRKQAMRRVGVVPEEPAAPPTLPVEQLLRFCSRVDPGWDADATRGRLERLAIRPDAIFGQLSKGQQKLVALALALGNAPDVLLLDDPTLGLDAAMRRALYEEIIGELADRGATVMIATHDLAGVERITDRIGLLCRGRLIEDAPLERLKARHASAAALEEIFLELTRRHDEVA